MPALQSPWFIPHVTVYMFSYSFLGCAFLLALAGLFTTKNNVMQAADTLVYIGMAFLTFGMLSGALWAKEGMGTLLELGPEGDMGSGDMAELHDVHTYAPSRQGIAQVFVPVADIQFPVSTDVLVGSQLSSFRSRQCTCI